MRFRFQINGVIGFSGEMSVDKVTAYLTEQLGTSELTGITVFKFVEKKDKGNRKRGV